MKRMKFYALLTGFVFLFSITKNASAQNQLNNSGFETWENEGSATIEPTDWNAFKSASGTLALYASQQITKSTVVRPGSTGSYSCLIWSKNILSVIANGNVTTGQINMGNMVPTSSDNYNITHTSQPAFSEALGQKPDSIEFWAKFVPGVAGGTDSARMRALIHDNYDAKDPCDAGTLPHVVGDATLNFPATNGQWVRFIVPFSYSGPATSPDFMLLTFTTNKTQGGGNGGDSLYIDDVSLIYNPDGFQEYNSNKNVSVYKTETDLIINLSYDKTTSSTIVLYNINGQMVYNTRITAQNVQHSIGLDQLKSGIYVISVTADDGRMFSQKISIN